MLRVTLRAALHAARADLRRHEAEFCANVRLYGGRSELCFRNWAAHEEALLSRLIFIEQAMQR